jgi:hypothetical protein
MNDAFLEIEEIIKIQKFSAEFENLGAPPPALTCCRLLRLFFVDQS